MPCGYNQGLANRSRQWVANGSRRDACEKAISTESVYNDIRTVGAAELAGGIGPKGCRSKSRRGLLLELGCTTCALYTKAVA